MFVSGQNLPYVQLSKANANRVEAVAVFILFNFFLLCPRQMCFSPINCW